MITRHRASAVVVSEGKLLVVRLEDPHSKVAELFVPGGKIEEDESSVTTAVRETFEETGVRIEVFNPVPLIKTYPFCWNDVVFECTTSFFAATCEDPSIPEIIVDAPYNKGAHWLDLRELERALGFNQQILAAISEILTNNFGRHLQF